MQDRCIVCGPYITPNAQGLNFANFPVPTTLPVPWACLSAIGYRSLDDALNSRRQPTSRVGLRSHPAPKLLQPAVTRIRETWHGETHALYTKAPKAYQPSRPLRPITNLDASNPSDSRLDDVYATISSRQSPARPPFPSFIPPVHIISSTYSVSSISPPRASSCPRPLT